MGIIRNAANRKIKGRIGDTTYYVSMDRQIARQALNSSNYGESARRSPSQQNRRVMWANLVNFYRASKGWMPKAFESKSAKQTDYNRFMSANLQNARIALTKAMASVSACVADAFIVSQGSLRSIQVSKLTNSWQTDIKLGELTIGDTTTVGQFAAAVIANNNFILEGDQISFISYQQYLDAQSTPHVICTAYEVTLYSNSSELLRNYLPMFCSISSDNGFLGTSTDISLGGFAYILSRNLGSGRLLVSTQELITNNDVLVSQYSSAATVKEAIESYGVDADTFLDTGSFPVSSTEQPLYISSLKASNVTIKPNAVITVPMNSLKVGGLIINLSAKTDLGVSSVEILPMTAEGEARSSSSTITSGITHTAGSNVISIDANQFSDFYGTDLINTISVTMSDGSVLTASFQSGNQSAD